MTTVETLGMSLRADNEAGRGHQSKLVLQPEFIQKIFTILNPSGYVIRNSIELFSLRIYSLSQTLEYSLFR